MPTDVSAAFEELARRLRTLPDETAAQGAHRISIDACLRSNLGMKSMFMSGSFGRGTNIPNHSDVDRFAIFPADVWEASSRATLVKVLIGLRHRFPTTSIGIDAPGVRINFADGEELNEVIPVFQVSEAPSARVFVMPDRIGRAWMKAAPEANANFIDKVDQARGERVKPLIRFTKAWKYVNNFRFISSFYLEMFVATYANTLPAAWLHRIEYGRDLEKVFRTLAVQSFPPIQDALGIQIEAAVGLSRNAARGTALAVANVAATANNHAAAALPWNSRMRAAFAVWQKLFKGKFPAYG